MKFNTAILYDIENLIGGYSNADMLFGLSLREIFEKITEKITGKIAIQRAYANWSDIRLNKLKDDIVELGIEPIQMFGFGKGPQKNASDIQLAIDAVDIAFTKDAIEVFVIVSGDGGFSSLAKKLHEYGKMVIGCAYEKTTNKVFQAVCDDFIWIEEPLPSDIDKTIRNPVVAAFAKEYKTLKKYDKNELISGSKEILKFLLKEKIADKFIRGKGVDVSMISELLQYRFEGFKPLDYGFFNFSEFVKFITKDTEVDLLLKEPNIYRIVAKGIKLEGFEVFKGEPKMIEKHSAENYKNILSLNPLRFLQFDVEIIKNISSLLIDNRVIWEKFVLNDLIKKIRQKTLLDEKTIKNTLLTLISSGAFTQTPDNVSLAERKLTFILKSPEQVILAIKREAKMKLKTKMQTINEAIFNELWKN